MRIRLLLVFLTMLATIPLCAQSADPLHDEITTALKGKIVTLRHFYSGSDLHYSADGDLVSKPEVGPWTLDGRLKVEKVSVKEDHVQLEGRRTWVRFTGAQSEEQVNAVTGIFTTLRIDLVQGPDRVARWQLALPKILFTKNTPISADAPEYWQSYLGAVRAEPKPQTQDQAPTEAKSIDRPLRVRVSQGVSEGLILHKEIPRYPQEARSAHHQGSVVMRAVIGKDGHMKDVQVIRPAGMGLDDAAVIAVRQWLYRPYFLKGDPVEVDTQITVNFMLESR